MSITMEEALGLPIPESKNVKNVRFSQTPKQIELENRRTQVITMRKNRIPIEEIAKHFNVDDRTIYRDIDEYIKNDMTNDLVTEWLQLGEELKNSGKKAEVYKGLSKIVTAVFEKQAKVEVNVTNNQQLTVNNDVNVSLELELLQNMVYGTIDNIQADKMESTPKNHIQQ